MPQTDSSGRGHYIDASQGGIGGGFPFHVVSQGKFGTGFSSENGSYNSEIGLSVDCFQEDNPTAPNPAGFVDFGLPGAFTLEFYYMPILTGEGANVIFEAYDWDAAVYNYMIAQQDGRIHIASNVPYAGVAAVQTVGTGTLSGEYVPSGGYDFIVIDRDEANVVRLYVNHELVAQGGTALSFTAPTSSAYIIFLGNNSGHPNGGVVRNIDEIRLTKGVSRYGDRGVPLEVSTCPFPNTIGEDVYFGSVVFLAHIGAVPFYDGGPAQLRLTQQVLEVVGTGLNDGDDPDYPPFGASSGYGEGGGTSGAGTEVTSRRIIVVDTGII